MPADTLFAISQNVVLLGWLLLLVVPEWKYTKPVVQNGLVPIILSLIYLYLIVIGWGKADGSFGSIEGIRSLFQNDVLLVAGWIHYLAFDLWLGSWEYADSKKHSIHRLIVLPCQLLTFIFGPIGLLLYLTIRGIKTRRIAHENF